MQAGESAVKTNLAQMAENEGRENSFQDVSDKADIIR